jgi:hypothetical protein
MKVLIIAHGADLTQATREAQDVLNILQAGGCNVHLLANQDVTLDCFDEVLDHGPFDLVWLIVHSGSDGFLLADEVISSAQLGQWLHATRCRQVVLNSCFSAEHVDEIQRAATVDIVATIDPSGVKDRLARSTGVYLARAFIDTGDLEEACLRASGNGLVQYRWFPAGDRLRSDGRRIGLADKSGDSKLEEQLTSLLRAVRGDAENGYIGLVGRVNDIQTQLRTFTDEQRAWRAETERRLATLEASRNRALSSRISLIVSLALVVLVLGLFVVLK